MPIPRDQWRSVRLEDQVDAIIKLPAKPTPIGPLPDVCGEPGYAAMHIARIETAGGPTGQAEYIKNTCK